MIYNLANEKDKEAFKQRANYLFVEQKKVELKERRKPRTYKQNRYLHLVLGWYGLELGYTLEEVKQDIFKRDICEEFFTTLKNGRLVTRSTSDLNTLEMTNALEKFRNHASADLGIYLPAPNETELLHNLEEQLYQYGNAQYI